MYVMSYHIRYCVRISKETNITMREKKRMRPYLDTKGGGHFGDFLQASASEMPAAAKAQRKESGPRRPSESQRRSKRAWAGSFRGFFVPGHARIAGKLG